MSSLLAKLLPVINAAALAGGGRGLGEVGPPLKQWAMPKWMVGPSTPLQSPEERARALRAAEEKRQRKAIRLATLRASSGRPNRST